MNRFAFVILICCLLGIQAASAATEGNSDVAASCTVVIAPPAVVSAPATVCGQGVRP